jgi:DNA-binding transcriptional LysR family regulator
VRLTAAGKVFFPEAARILLLSEEVVVTAHRAGKGEQGAVDRVHRIVRLCAAAGVRAQAVRTRARRPLTLKEMFTTSGARCGKRSSAYDR